MADSASAGSNHKISRGDGPPASKANKRPNYRDLHAKPLPLDTYPLPNYIPHNPLSILYVAYAYIKQVFWDSPSSHAKTSQHFGYFSPETHSVHVTDEASVRALWENGFFGKGTLSRSEPTWLVREKARKGVVLAEEGLTSEDVTRRRREERKAFKQERARKLREEIELKLKADRDGSPPKEVPEGLQKEQSREVTVPEEAEALSAGNSEPGKTAGEKPSVTTVQQKTAPSLPGQEPAPTPQADEVDITNQEHLQLDLPEAFFLTYALGVLVILSPTTGQPLTVSEIFQLFVATTASLSTPSTSPQQHPSPAPDNPFLLNYVAYHHFRSLGWVVRSGVKFGADLLLYNRGPVFSHAEFAVLVIPAYSHPYYWKSTSPNINNNQTRKKSKPWHWLHMVNRVQSQVRKTLVLCYVDVPPPPLPFPLAEGTNKEELDITKFLGTYRVREMVLKRWVPNRSRD